MSVSAFQLGDVVRVRAARRRDVRFRIVELTETHVRAVNEAGGEAFYEHDRFEHVSEPPVLESVPTPEPIRSEVPDVTREPVPAATLDDATVRLRPGESIDFALRRLKRQCEKGNVFADYRRHRAFIPKPQRRREKSRARVRRAKIGF